MAEISVEDVVEELKVVAGLLEGVVVVDGILEVTVVEGTLGVVDGPLEVVVAEVEAVVSCLAQ